MALVKVSIWMKEKFRADSQPDKRRIYQMIDRGELPGQRIGNLYYVEEIDPLLEKVMH